VKILRRCLYKVTMREGRSRGFEDLREGGKEQLVRDDGVHSGEYKTRPQSEKIWEERSGGWRRW
jgi:hypothetical protein